MKLPAITTAKTERTRQVEEALTANYVEFQYCFVDFLVEYLEDLSRVFRGDLTLMLVLAVIGQSRIRAVRDAMTTGLSPAEVATIRSGVSASRVADLTSVPRQTVRRKLAQLRDKGWVEQYEDGTWGMAVSQGASNARQDLKEADRRALARVARMFADLESIVAPPS